MTPEQFTYWLKGYSESCGKQPSVEQWEYIKSKFPIDSSHRMIFKTSGDKFPEPPYTVTCSNIS